MAVTTARRAVVRQPRWRDRFSIWRTAIIVVICVTYLYPFAFMVGTALKSQTDFINNQAGFPTSLTFEHFEAAWNETNPGLSTALKNSAIAVSIGVVLCVAMVSLAAFYILRRQNRLTGALLGIFGSLWLVPPVVFLVPFFTVLSQFGLIDNLFVLGVVYGTIWAPLLLWLVFAYLIQAIPKEVLEAAEIDGASLWQQYWRIVLPLARPALGCVAALTFIWAWGDILFAVILMQDVSKYTIVPAAASLVNKYDLAIQATTAAATITILPTLVIFMFAQKAIVRGITGGVSK